MEKYIVMKDITRKVRRFNLQGRTLEFKIKPVPTDAEPVGWVKDSISQLIYKATEDLQPHDQVSFSFCSKDFERGDGWIRFQEAAKITIDDVWNAISSVYQSNSKGLNTDTFCLGVTSVRMPVGKGRGRNYNNFTEECVMRKGIVTIQNKDNLCLPRAIVVGIANATKDLDYVKIRRDIGKLQTQKSKKLLEDTGITIPEEGSGIPELETLQQFLKNEYRITVFQYGTKGFDVIFKGPDAPLKINLLYHEGHFNVITSLTAAFCCSYFCDICNCPYEHKNRHKCSGKCPCCLQTPPCRQEAKVTCADCNRQFRSEECFNKHKHKSSKADTPCEEIRKCTLCLKIIKKNREHTCGEIFCKICQKHVLGDHLCHMQVDKQRPRSKDLLFVFYDLETRQQRVIRDNEKLHEPNLCVFKQYCDGCIDRDIRVCEKCGVRLQKIKCQNVVPAFLHHLLMLRKKFKNVVVLAHNSQGFDGQFILKYILEETDLTPELITRGTKLVLMQVGNLKFVDSLNYIPMALSRLPKAFGLTELKKGYFPHLFNTLENENYVGKLPPIEYYSPDTMKPEDRQKFIAWYQDHKDDDFDMQRDLVAYCISDVEILAGACIKLRDLFIKEGNVCPFTEAVTLPSACNKVFRRNFLLPETIGIIPKNGYRWRENQSKIAIQWLIWEEKQREINIIHAAKSREVSIAGVRVDGYCSETKQIFEFHGCYFHGCPDCILYNRDVPCRDDGMETPDSRHETTVAKTEKLRGLGYHVIEKRECEFRRELERNKEMRNYTANHSLLINLPLNPRDAFYGGRTDATKQYKEICTDEKIKYRDVCSLYPFICKYGKYPIGHPKVYTGDTCKKLNLDDVEGLIKCKILPPQDLYHPVLPTKMNEKLMFVLCRTCGEEYNDKTECHHGVEERALNGTWVIDEVKAAIARGYKILDIFEIWHYQVERYDKENNTGGLFTEYINRFLKIKQQSSGWPKHCKNQEEKEMYIQEYFDKERVKLNFDQVEVNPALRQFGKAVITSFWGKLGQKENQSKTSIVHRPEELYKILSDPSVNTNSVLPVNEKTLIVNWGFKEETYDTLPTVNVCLAAYTTAQARLKLYSYLEKLGERVLYYDTDSVIYVSKERENYDVPLGNMLGEMTDELEEYGPDSYIVKFASGGPKLYAFIVYSPTKNTFYEVCKAKGICINHKVSKDVNFERLRDMILKDEPPLYITSENIRRTKTHDVVTREETKIFKVNFKKRRCIENYDSVPFGFKRQKLL